MSPVRRPGPYGGALPTPEPLLPLGDADVDSIPLLFESVSERMRELVVAANKQGPANDPLMNLLNEGLPQGHGFDEVGSHYYNAGLVYAFVIAERKYRVSFGGDIPPLDRAAYERGAEAVAAARAYARSLSDQELWRRVRAKEARYVGSVALSGVFDQVVGQVRAHLAASGVENERSEEALHLGMVEGTIFLGAALRDPWDTEIATFPVADDPAAAS